MTKWISVKDRLPKPNSGEVLLLCETHEFKGIKIFDYHTGNFELWYDRKVDRANRPCWGITTLADGKNSYVYWVGEDFDRITHWAKIEPPEVTE